MADHLDRQADAGWMLPYLIALDTAENPEKDYAGHGRWSYWLEACARGSVPEADIPRLAFTETPDRRAEDHLIDTLRPYVGRDPLDLRP